MMLMAVALLALLWAGASEVRADSPAPLFVHAYPVDTQGRRRQGTTRAVGRPRSLSPGAALPKRLVQAVRRVVQEDEVIDVIERLAVAVTV